MAVIHISEAEAASDFSGLLARVKAGEHVVIEDNAAPVAVLRPAEVSHTRLLSDAIAIARQRGSTATLDGGFSGDLEQAIRDHEAESLTDPWE